MAKSCQITASKADGTQQTLLSGQVPQVVSGTSIKRIALAIVSILKNDSQPIRSLHQNLDDWNYFQYKA